MTAAEPGCFPNIVDQVRVVATLPDRPDMDAGRGGARQLKYGCRLTCEGKGAHEVEGDVLGWARFQFGLQHARQTPLSQYTSGFSRSALESRRPASRC